MNKISKEEAIEKLNKHNSNIILIGEYSGYLDKTQFKCKVCGNVIFTSVCNILHTRRKNGCIKCEKRSKNKKERSRSKSHEQYLVEIQNIWGDLIEIIGQYDRGSKKIEAKCNKCGLIWNPEAKALLANHGCPKCGHEKNRKSTQKKHSTYVDEVSKVHNNRISVIGNYEANDRRILVRCNKCQYEWLPVARNMLKGRGCPKCKLNKGETLIYNILIDLDINFKAQYIIKGLKTLNDGVPIFDFAIFDADDRVKLIIEFDGIQHYKPIDIWGGEERFFRQQIIDDYKNRYCDENNIKMVRIKYTELNNINHNYIKNIVYGE